VELPDVFASSSKNGKPRLQEYLDKVRKAQVPTAILLTIQYGIVPEDERYYKQFIDILPTENLVLAFTYTDKMEYSDEDSEDYAQNRSDCVRKEVHEVPFLKDLLEKVEERFLAFEKPEPDVTGNVSQLHGYLESLPPL
jgi:hypothetical protein